ncbi:hypothetical protein ACJRO7_020856 [Eucalyptus globulus]|uniref:Uncharacterized protein n=1 Tax=Eucalyptus globulus TaxID=34317 RepID=A0ABD3KMU8_EUCGL
MNEEENRPISPSRESRSPTWTHCASVQNRATSTDQPIPRRSNTRKGAPRMHNRHKVTANRSQSLHRSSNEVVPLTSSQPDDDYSPLGIYSHRAEEQGRNLPLHSTPLTMVNGSGILEMSNDSHPCNSKFLPDLHSAGAVEDGRLQPSRRTIAAEPSASAIEDQNLRSIGSAYLAPLQHE